MEQADALSAVREQRLNRWIEHYADDVVKVCFLSLNDRAQAEDAMQDTFLKAWRYMPHYERRQIENEKAWLMKIAVNVCRDYRRTGWFRHVEKRASLEELPLRDQAEEGRDRELTMDIMALPVKYKQIVVLYFYQGFTLREAAEALGLSAATAHRRLKKAEEMLKASLEGGERK